MLQTSMLVHEENRIFEELLAKFDSLTEEQMQVVGVTPEWSAKDLLAHLTRWEASAAEEVRELKAGTWAPRKRTREEGEQINREVVAANRQTPRHCLREQFSRARSEIVSALQEAPQEMDEAFPLARIVRSQCVRHLGHHLAQLRNWVELAITR